MGIIIGLFLCGIPAPSEDELKDLEDDSVILPVPWSWTARSVSHDGVCAYASSVGCGYFLFMQKKRNWSALRLCFEAWVAGYGTFPFFEIQISKAKSNLLLCSLWQETNSQWGIILSGRTSLASLQQIEHSDEGAYRHDFNITRADWMQKWNLE